MRDPRLYRRSLCLFRCMFLRLLRRLQGSGRESCPWRWRVPAAAMRWQWPWPIPFGRLQEPFRRLPVNGRPASGIYLDISVLVCVCFFVVSRSLSSSSWSSLGLSSGSVTASSSFVLLHLGPSGVSALLLVPGLTGRIFISRGIGGFSVKSIRSSGPFPEAKLLLCQWVIGEFFLQGFQLLLPPRPNPTAIALFHHRGELSPNTNRSEKG